MTDALKPCPFCGSNPHEARPMIYGGWAVLCKCGARGPSFREDLATEHKRGTHSKASEAWNRRAQHQEQPQKKRVVIGYVPISAIEETPLDGYVPVYAPEMKD